MFPVQLEGKVIIHKSGVMAFDKANDYHLVKNYINKNSLDDMQLSQFSRYLVGKFGRSVNNGINARNLRHLRSSK